MTTCSSLKKTETSNSPVSLHIFVNFPSRICITCETMLFQNPHFFGKKSVTRAFLMKKCCNLKLFWWTECFVLVFYITYRRYYLLLVTNSHFFFGIRWHSCGRARCITLWGIYVRGNWTWPCSHCFNLDCSAAFSTNIVFIDNPGHKRMLASLAVPYMKCLCLVQILACWCPQHVSYKKTVFLIGGKFKCR